MDGPTQPKVRVLSPFWKGFLAASLGFSLPIITCSGVIIAGVLGLKLLTDREEVMPSLSSGDAVALIRVEGVIVSRAGPFDVVAAASGSIIDHIESAANDDRVRSIVLAVNSPGGGVVATDLIYHALVSQPKPFVVSMGDIAASGGYYVSAPADWIIATPNTLTGSIGVVSEFISIEGLMEDHGVKAVTIASGPRKDFGSPLRTMTKAEQDYWQDLTDETHAAFVDIVIEGRDLSAETVRQLADGRVYTGRQALDMGLVDALGYEDDAIAKAAELGGIEGEPRIVEYREVLALHDILIGFATYRRLPSRAEVLGWLIPPALEARWVGQ